MKKLYCVISKGLLIGWPVDTLAAWLNEETPEGIHFDVVGGADPQPLAGEIIANLIARDDAGFTIIFGGHSMGAMLSFYAAMALAEKGIKSPLFFDIDPTDWGTNAPSIPQWSEVVFPPNTGRYFAPANVATWLHFNQNWAPGGGTAERAPGNTVTDFRSLAQPDENHLSIVNAAPVRKAILEAVLAAAA